MTFPFDIIDWLFGVGGQAAGAIGNWFSSIGGFIASGIEGGFVSLLKDIWEVARPFVLIPLGVIIVLLGSAWFFLGSANFGSVASLAAMLIK